jgi:hypothetical protein
MGILSGVLIAAAASAATYYVSPSGSDSYTSAQAQNIGTPWKTIQKAATNMYAGDTCQIRAGTYRETVTPSRSGTSPSLPITFQAYGTETVIITGNEPVTGWTADGGNIYYASTTLTFAKGNQVFQNNAMKPLARWPDNANVWQGSRPATPPSSTYTDTWSYMDSATPTNGSFTDAALPTPTEINLVNCVVHSMAGYGWSMVHSTVTGHSGTTITTSYTNNVAAYRFTTGNEYYITAGPSSSAPTNKSLMTSNGEWFYDSTNSRLYFYSNTGAPSNVEAKKRTTGFNLSNRMYIKLVNLDLFACTIINTSGSSNCTYDGLSMQHLNHSSDNTSSFWGIILRNGDVLRNSDLSFDSRGLVTLAGSDISVVNNHLHDSGYLPNWTAMVDSSLPSYYRNLVSHNTLHAAGRALTGSIGRAGIFEYNDMYDGMRLTTDGALFYKENIDAGNTIVRYNLIHDSDGPAGHLGGGVHGFYLDCFSANWIVHHNIIWNLSGYAMMILNRHSFNMIFNNTCWDTDSIITGFPQYMDEYGESGTRIFNNLFPGLPIGDWADDIYFTYNLFDDPLFVDPANGDFRLQATSDAVEQGIDIPGVTDVYSGSWPDMGALEYGGTDWTTSCGHNFTTPPNPTYSFPTMVFCNEVINGGFESASLSPNWTATGTVSLNYQTAWVSGGNNNTRSAYYSARLASAGAEIYQTVNNLQPGRRYMLYAGVKKMNANDSITIGVRNYGRTTLTTPASVADTGWNLYSMPFVTGATSTSAQAYIHANTVATAAYVDDVALVIHAVEEVKTPMPLVFYPFDETSGSTAHDLSTNGHDGTLYGSPSFVSGIINNALDFDGVNDYVLTPSFATPTAVTVACWLKSDTATWNQPGCLVSKRPSFVLAPTQNSKNISFLVYNSPTAYTSLTWTPPADFNITDWHHYAGVFSPSTQQMLFYVDGVWQETLTAAITMNGDSGATYIGCDDGYVGTRHFGGQMDDVRIYDCALTGEMIEEICNNTDPEKILHLAFNESAGTTAWDRSGTGNHGTLNGSMTDSDWVAGKLGNALDFDGSDDYVDCDNNTSLQVTGNLTLSFWIKPSNVAARRQNPIEKSYLGEFALTVETTGLLHYYHHGTTGNGWWGWEALSTGTIISNSWQHILITRDAATRTMNSYYNGELKATVTYPSNSIPTVSTNNLQIGKGYAGIFVGQMDDVRIYSRVLDWQEILDIGKMLDYPYEGL